MLKKLAAAWRALFRRRPETWKERGEPRGRTKAEPEGTLHIKVIRADGTVEDHGVVPAQITRRR